jgi:hypothetical protein
MKTDPTTQGYCTSLNPQMIDVLNNIKLISLFYNYDNLTEETLNELALMLNVKWYDVEADIDVKRHLIQHSDEVYLYLGTAKGIQLVFEAWEVTVYVLEWFNYGGDPYHYKLVIDYTYYEPLYDVEGNEVWDSEDNQIYVLKETPFLPDGALVAKLALLLPYLQPVRCVLDSIETVAGLTENTYEDIEALGDYADLEGSFYWDLHQKRGWPFP